MPFENPLQRKQIPAQKKQPPLATKGRQDTGNTSLSSIDSKIKTPRDNELVSIYYKANKNGEQYTLGDFILRSDIINTIYNPKKPITTLWFNQNTGLFISEPPQADLDVSSTNIVTVTNPFNLEATQLLIKTNLDNLLLKDFATQSGQNPVGKYRISDEDSLGTTKYYGFVSATNTNKWIILRLVSGTTPSYRYANGINNGGIDYDTAVTGGWAARSTLNYTYLFNLTSL